MAQDDASHHNSCQDSIWAQMGRYSKSWWFPSCSLEKRKSSGIWCSQLFGHSHHSCSHVWLWWISLLLIHFAVFLDIFGLKSPLSASRKSIPNEHDIFLLQKRCIPSFSGKSETATSGYAIFGQPCDECFKVRPLRPSPPWNWWQVCWRLVAYCQHPSDEFLVWLESGLVTTAGNPNLAMDKQPLLAYRYVYIYMHTYWSDIWSCSYTQKYSVFSASFDCQNVTLPLVATGTESTNDTVDVVTSFFCWLVARGFSPFNSFNSQ